MLDWLSNRVDAGLELGTLDIRNIPAGVMLLVIAVAKAARSLTPDEVLAFNDAWGDFKTRWAILDAARDRSDS